MTEPELNDRLAAALSELPGGPIVAPVGLAVLGAARLRRRRRVQAAAAMASVVLATAGVSLAVGTDPTKTTQPATTPVREICASTTAGQELRPAPTDARPQRTAAEVREGYQLIQEPSQRVVDVYLAARRQQLVWVVQLLGTDGGQDRRVRGSAVIYDDIDLSRPIFTTCALPKKLEGATLDVEPPAGYREPQGTPLLLVTPSAVGVVAAGQASAPWSVIQRSPTSDVLTIDYGTSCNEPRTIQVEETDDYVLVQLVRPGSSGGALCISGERRRVQLSQPLGDRLLLHAALFELPTEAYTRALARTPVDLPPGAIASGETTTATSHVTTYRLTGATLRFTAGITPPYGTFLAHASVGGHPARLIRTGDGSYLSWEDGGLGMTAVYADPTGVGPLDLPAQRAALNQAADSMYAVDYLGLTLEQAEDLATRAGLQSRVVILERKPVVVDKSYSSRRVNLEILDGKVRGATFR